MTHRYGIDTSVLLRLITAQPPALYTYTPQLGLDCILSLKVCADCKSDLQSAHVFPKIDRTK